MFQPVSIFVQNGIILDLIRRRKQLSKEYGFFLRCCYLVYCKVLWRGSIAMRRKGKRERIKMREKRVKWVENWRIRDMKNGEDN